MYLNRKGSITVFLCIVLPIVMLLCLVLTDIYLLNNGKKIMEEQSKNASLYVLGQYSAYLKEHYDLYGYCISDEILHKSVREFIESNTLDLSIYRFNIEAIEIKKEDPLIDPDVLQYQIQHVMKDAIYQSAITEIYDRLYTIKSVSDVVDALTIKFEFDEKVKDINSRLKIIKQLVEGEDLDSYVNILAKNNYIGKSIEEFYTLYEQISAITQQIDILTKRADEGIYEVNLLLEDRGHLKEKLVTVYNQGIQQFITALQEVNERVLDEIELVVLDSNGLYVISNTLQSKINSIQNCPDYLLTMIDYSIDMIENIERAIVKESFDQIKIKINQNINILIIEAISMEKNYQDIMNEVKDIDQPDTNSFEQYHDDITVQIIDDTILGKGQDDRSFFENLGEEILKEQVGEDAKIEDYMILPSKQKEIEQEIFDVDVSHDSTDDVNKKMNKIKDLVSQIKENATEEVLLTEYILLKFSNASSKEKKVAQSFFESEIEYILYGSRSQNSNNLFSKSTLLLMRFGLNAAHVFSDSEKQIKANAIATTVAGWWTFGVGIPVIANLLSCAWAVAEAGVDVKTLFDGEALAIYKLSGDWKLDIGLNKVGKKTPDILKIDYEDYLRIFLLTMPTDKKLKHIQDIIYVNSPGTFDLYDTYTKVNIVMTVSQRSLLGKRYTYEIQESLSY